MEPLLTEKFIGFAMKVHNVLGAGFLEKVYENALVHELKKNGIFVLRQKAIPVMYDGIGAGDFVADVIAQDKVLMELKALAGFSDDHTAICLNYLRATNLPVCLLINFGKPKLQVKRLVGGNYVDEPLPI